MASNDVVTLVFIQMLLCSIAEQSGVESKKLTELGRNANKQNHRRRDVGFELVSLDGDSTTGGGTDLLGPPPTPQPTGTPSNETWEPTEEPLPPHKQPPESAIPKYFKTIRGNVIMVYDRPGQDQDETWLSDVFYNKQTGDMCESNKRMVYPMEHNFSLLHQWNASSGWRHSRSITPDAKLANCDWEPYLHGPRSPFNPIFSLLPFHSFLNTLEWRDEIMIEREQIVVNPETGAPEPYKYTDVQDVFYKETYTTSFTYIIGRYDRHPRVYAVRDRIEDSTKTAVWDSFAEGLGLSGGPLGLEPGHRCLWPSGCTDLICTVNRTLEFHELWSAYLQFCSEMPPYCWEYLRIAPGKGNTSVIKNTPLVSGFRETTDTNWYDYVRLVMNASRGFDRWYEHDGREISCDLRNTTEPNNWGGSAALLQPCFPSYDSCVALPNAPPEELYAYLMRLCTDRTCDHRWNDTFRYNIFKRATWVFNDSYHEYRCYSPVTEGYLDACDFGPGLSFLDRADNDYGQDDVVQSKVFKVKSLEELEKEKEEAEAAADGDGWGGETTPEEEEPAVTDWSHLRRGEVPIWGGEGDRPQFLPTEWDDSKIGMQTESISLTLTVSLIPEKDDGRFGTMSELDTSKVTSNNLPFSSAGGFSSSQLAQRTVDGNNSNETKVLNETTSSALSPSASFLLATSLCSLALRIFT